MDEISDRDRFLILLEWMLALEQRHSDALEPGLVHIAYDAVDVRDLTYGASDAASKLTEVLICLQQVFRGTDLITREGMNFWILAPFTQIDPVMEKVRKVLTTAPQSGLAIAHSNVKVYMMREHLDNPAAKVRDAEGFLAHLLTQPGVELAI
jgi:hypothetical protein